MLQDNAREVCQDIVMAETDLIPGAGLGVHLNIIGETLEEGALVTSVSPCS